MLPFFQSGGPVACAFKVNTSLWSWNIAGKKQFFILSGFLQSIEPERYAVYNWSRFTGLLNFVHYYFF